MFRLNIRKITSNLKRNINKINFRRNSTDISEYNKYEKICSKIMFYGSPIFGFCIADNIPINKDETAVHYAIRSTSVFIGSTFLCLIMSPGGIVLLPMFLFIEGFYGIFNHISIKYEKIKDRNKENKKENKKEEDLCLEFLNRYNK